MKVRINNIIFRPAVGILSAAFLVVGFGSASVVGPLQGPALRNFTVDANATATLGILAQLGVLQRASGTVIEELLSHQARSGQPLEKILQNPVWAGRLGFKADSFKATWYAANPFELLPVDLQKAIKKTTTPFTTRKEVKLWCKKNRAPETWVKALNLALIETTPINLWRASRGQRPYAKNGQYLEPIIIEKGTGQFEVRNGHIATDPRIIPTNTQVVLLVRINGQVKIIRAKAADIGEAIRGRHVDLPITIKSKSTDQQHSIWFPKDYIRNPRVTILTPARKVSPGRKA